MLLGIPDSRSQSQPQDVSVELRQKADVFFQKRDFSSAAPLYSQLISLDQADSLSYYKYGICMLASSKDRKTAVAYLEVAAEYSQAPPDIDYYYGRALMARNNFLRAKTTFERFLEKGQGDRDMKSNARLFIENCNHGIELQRDRKNMAVLEEREIPRKKLLYILHLSGRIR